MHSLLYTTINPRAPASATSHQEKERIVYTALLALAIATNPMILDSARFIEQRDARWVVITTTDVRTLSGTPVTFRLLMTRSNYCALQGVSGTPCTQAWQRISPEKKIGDNEIEVMSDRDFVARFEQEPYCAYTFHPEPYTPRMCDDLWHDTIREIPDRKKVED